MTPLVIRADAGPLIGTGHAMRCIALAQAWQDGGGRAAFVMAGGAGGLTTRLTAEGVDIKTIDAEPGSGDDARRTIEQAARAGARWVVVDGYRFSGEFQRSIRDACFRVLALDDYGHAEHYHADLVLNQNLHANEGLYSRRETHTRLLLGTEFTLLRREFVSRRGWRRETPEVARKVLVTLGGSDPENITEEAVRALGMAPIAELEAVVVVGAENPHRPGVEAAARRSPVRVEVQVNVRNMADVMAWADVAVAAGGSSIWEMALLGLPTIAIGRGRQETELLQHAAARGLLTDLSAGAVPRSAAIAQALQELMRDRRRRADMSRAMMRVIDGCGAGRVVERMRG